MQSSTAGLGATVGTWITVGPWILVRSGRHAVSLGQVRATASTLGVSLLWTLADGRYHSAVVVGARLGWLRLAGEAASTRQTRASSLGAATGGPLSGVTVERSLVRGLIGTVVAEAGYNLFPVRGLVNGENEASNENVWVAAAIGVGKRW